MYKFSLFYCLCKDELPVYTKQIQEATINRKQVIRSQIKLIKQFKSNQYNLGKKILVKRKNKSQTQ